MSPIEDERIEVLSRARAYLISGEFEKVERLADLKIRIANRLSKSGANAVSDAVKGELRRNEAMLNAAREGLKAAKHRVAQIRTAAGKISYYGTNGQRTEVQTGGPTFQHRA